MSDDMANVRKGLDTAGLERIYDLMAEAIDAVEPDRRELFLAKLAFVLANMVGDADSAAHAVEIARRDL